MFEKSIRGFQYLDWMLTVGLFREFLSTITWSSFSTKGDWDSSFKTSADVVGAMLCGLEILL